MAARKSERKSERRPRTASTAVTDDSADKITLTREDFQEIRSSSENNDMEVTKKIAAAFIAHFQWTLDLEKQAAANRYNTLQFDAPPDTSKELSKGPGFSQYLAGICTTVRDGSRMHKLQLLFEIYARQDGPRIGWQELQDVVLRHVSCTGKLRHQGPLKNEHLPALIEDAFNASADSEGLLGRDTFLDLWQEFVSSVGDHLRLDLQVLSADIARMDAEDKALFASAPRHDKSESWDRLIYQDLDHDLGEIDNKVASTFLPT